MSADVFPNGIGSFDELNKRISNNMTTEQQNKAWASLPDDFKEEVRNLYNNYRVLYRTPQEVVRDILEILFGVSATAPTPKFKVGDKVKIVSTNNAALKNKVGIIAERPTGVSNDLLKVEFPTMSFAYLEPYQLFPYTEPTSTDEDEKDQIQRCAANMSAYLKRTMESANKSMPTLDQQIEAHDKKTWDEYRAELVKVIAPAMIGSNYQSTMAFNFDYFFDDLLTIVDGIIERLKGEQSCR